jgi:hypothetical protein
MNERSYTSIPPSLRGQVVSSFTESPSAQCLSHIIHSVHTTNHRRLSILASFSVIPCSSCVLKTEKVSSSDNSSITCQAVRCHNPEYLDIDMVVNT